MGMNGMNYKVRKREEGSSKSCQGDALAPYLMWELTNVLQRDIAA